MKSLVFVDSAAGDLDSIIDYIALDNPVAAEKVYRGIVETAGRLCQFPDLGRAGRLPATRELKVSALPYLFVYEVDPQTSLFSRSSIPRGIWRGQ